MTSEEYIQLYQKYLAGLCTAEEEERLFSYQDAFKLPDSRKLEEQPNAEKILGTNIYNRIQNSIAPRRVSILKPWIGYAAAMLLALCGIAYYVVNISYSPTDKESLATANKSTLGPDLKIATLALADGTIIPLDSISNGLLAHTDGMDILKSEANELAYTTTHSSEKNPQINKIIIPKGYQYKVILADGTKVWLNSASTLTYPSFFSGGERQVELSGEAYFEVAKNTDMPFSVKLNEAEIQVLGTHFNVSAYSDDSSIKTTLLEGSVRLSRSQKQSVVLKPGQQGIINAQELGIQTKEVNTTQASAWKDGYFIFKDDTLEDVMKQISRWYNIEIVYKKPISDKIFGGIYAKSKKLEELLTGLELTGLVKFKIIEGNSTAGRRVLVMD